jgi:hypothetical protein
VAVELAGDDDVLAIRGDIRAVGALGLGDQEQQPLGDGLLHGDDGHAVALLELAGLDQLLGLFPVGHVEEVGVLGGAAGLEGRAAALDAADVALGAEGVGEAPAEAVLLTGVGEILAIGGQLEGEGVLRLDAPLLLVELPVGQAAAVLVVELLQGDVADIAVRRGVLGGLHDVFGVGGDEGPAVLGAEQGVDDDLLSLEVLQVDDRHAGVGLVVDEEVATVVVALGL